MSNKRTKSEIQGPAKSISSLQIIVTFLSGILTAVLIGILTPLAIDRFSITEPRLVQIGDSLSGLTLLQARAKDNILEAHARNVVRVKNYGFRRGHIDKVEIVQDGLREFPTNLKVLHVDKTDIGWLEEKDIAFEFIAQVQPFPERYKSFVLKTYYYGPSGNEIFELGIAFLMTNQSTPENENITGEVCIREKTTREVKCGEVAIK